MYKTCIRTNAVALLNQTNLINYFLPLLENNFLKLCAKNKTLLIFSFYTLSNNLNSFPSLKISTKNYIKSNIMAI